MQRVDPAHDHQFGCRNGSSLIVEIAPAEPEQVRLPGQRQFVFAVDHRFALSRPALLSAPAKKSFSSVSSPILACRTFRSTAGVASIPETPEPKTPAAPSNNCAFQAVIWFGCKSYWCANSASVFSPLIAANATLALKPGAWVRRARLVMVSPVTRHCRRSQADFPPIDLSEFPRPPLHNRQNPPHTLREVPRAGWSRR